MSTTERLGENKCPRCGAPSLASVVCPRCSLGPVPGSAPVDERIAFLREGKTDVLVAILGEIAEPAHLGCSRNFFMLAMDRRFRTTEPEQLFDLIVGVLRARVPNGPCDPAGGKPSTSTDLP